MPVGLCTSPWRSRWTVVLKAFLGRGGWVRASRRVRDVGRRAGCSGQGGHDPVDRVVVVGGGEEPHLESAGREVHPLVEHGVEERGEAVAALPRGCLEV